jgi:hypothetical protein
VVGTATAASAAAARVCGRIGCVAVWARLMAKVP